MIITKDEAEEISAMIDGVTAFKISPISKMFNHEETAKIIINLIKRVEALEKL